ncbi:unnamed protein product [Arabidopsis lyrata]|uniref:KIB1-4 beta-propeller domain-containing protein n=1 Tax=Arabidopsis lyrata subsp. lyrata TaxID=81972 RepID=D7KER4_ARALL|nr:hypothetical protein ARALYDRAFT_473234 [Arabidopsis lyrata subsp. lyrata]CAH8253943.1 unnamed protein product [Arabidopsis lyrata]
MSRLVSKLSPFIHKNSRSIRSFSSSTTGPCVSICTIMEPSPDGNLGQLLLFNIPDLKLVTADKTYPDELYDAQLVGASHGWGLFSNRTNRSVLLSDYLNPYASKSKPKMIHLPFFTPTYSGQTEVVCNVAMSSPPPDQDDDQEDWVVGIKFLGRQLSLCRPRRDLRWTNILTPFESWEISKLMYSKKDQRFYLLAPGGNYLCSWDLNFKEDKKPKFKEDKKPKFHELVLHDLPNMPRSHSKLLDSFSREDHWVESPSGESTVNTPLKTPVTGANHQLFWFSERKDGRKHMRYTDDIGDLCIFISKGEDFCVKASSHPGLQPNSICLHGRLFAILNLTNRTLGCYEYPEGIPKRIPYLPYWLPPFSP